MYLQLEKVAFLIENRMNETATCWNLSIIFLISQVLWLILLLVYVDKKSSLEVFCCAVQFASVFTLAGSMTQKYYTSQF